MDEKLVERLTLALRRAEDGAGTLPAKEAVKLRPADWHAVTKHAREAATALTLAQARIRELETALEPFATRVLVATNLGDDLHPAWAPAFTVGEFRRAFRARSTKEAPNV